MNRFIVMIAGLALFLLPQSTVRAQTCSTNKLFAGEMCTIPEGGVSGCEIWHLVNSADTIDSFEVSADQKEVKVWVTMAEDGGGTCTQTLSPGLPMDWKITSVRHEAASPAELRINTGGSPLGSLGGLPIPKPLSPGD